MAPLKRKVFLGTFIHCKSRDELSYLFNTVVCVDDKGKITAVTENCDRARVESEVLPGLGWSLEEVEVREGGEDEFFFPGFIGEFPTPPHLMLPIRPAPTDRPGEKE